MGFIGISGIPGPWLHNAIATGAKLLKRLRFLFFEQEQFFDLNF
jgi:hypothetical protein